jgi:hypothetical protein
MRRTEIRLERTTLVDMLELAQCGIRIESEFKNPKFQFIYFKKK